MKTSETSYDTNVNEHNILNSVFGRTPIFESGLGLNFRTSSTMLYIS